MTRKMKSRSETGFFAIFLPRQARKINCGKDSCSAVLFSAISRLSRRLVRQSFSDGGSISAKGDISRAMILGLVVWIFVAISEVFAESFPNRPTAGELEEIVEQGMVCGNAVRERGLAVNDAGSFLPYCGHGQSYFASLQQELESLAPSYIDHINGPLNDDEDAFRYFTLATWRAAAELNASGFRRSTDGTTFYYGQMQAGDIIGSWILEDLQNGFGMLKWLPFFRNIVNVRTLFPEVTGEVDYSGSGSGAGFGVWYTLGGTLLGESGTYRIVLDARNAVGSGGVFYVSLGRSNGGWYMSLDGGALLLDTGHSSPPVVLPFSASVTFLDPSTLVQIFGCIKGPWGNPDSYSISFSANSVNVSATLDTAGENTATFEFFPVIKVPFTNSSQ